MNRMTPRSKYILNIYWTHTKAEEVHYFNTKDDMNYFLNQFREESYEIIAKFKLQRI